MGESLIYIFERRTKMSNENENEGKYLEDMLEETIANLIEHLETLEPGTEEHRATQMAICELYKVWIESNKVELEFEDRAAQREHDRSMKIVEEDIENRKLMQQQKSRNLETAVNLALGALGTILPLGFYGIWMAKGFKFEETGTFTSSTFKGLFRNFRPNKI